MRDLADAMAADSLDAFIARKELTSADREQIYQADNARRYDYFVKYVARAGRLWALWDGDGWLTTTAKDGKERFLVWPDKTFAQRAFEEQGRRLWPNARVDSIELRKWLDEYLPDITAYEDKVWVFPASNLDGGVVDPRDLSGDIKKEIAFIRRR